LIEAIKTTGSTDPALDPLFDEAIRETIERFEATGSPVITDGEQRKYHNFGTYCVDGLPNIAPDGFKLTFIHHTRQWPRLTAGPFRYLMSADSFIDVARRYTKKPLKQAVISPSALSLMYPAEPLPGYSREEFIDDLVANAARGYGRSSFAAGGRQAIPRRAAISRAGAGDRGFHAHGKF
jgi:5-methyltetrahydropteroyltriglutamate--homocysteine methyltransferase